METSIQGARKRRNEFVIAIGFIRWISLRWYYKKESGIIVDMLSIIRLGLESHDNIFNWYR